MSASDSPATPRRRKPRRSPARGLLDRYRRVTNALALAHFIIAGCAGLILTLVALFASRAGSSVLAEPWFLGLVVGVLAYLGVGFALRMRSRAAVVTSLILFYLQVPLWGALAVLGGAYWVIQLFCVGLYIWGGHKALRLQKILVEQGIDPRMHPRDLKNHG